MKRGALLIASLFALASVAWADGTKSMETALGVTVTVPAAVPDKTGLTPLGAVVLEGGLLVLLFDDPRTPRAVDYLEVYDPQGNLLQVAWMDQFGLVRLARDLSLVDPDAEAPARILVMNTDAADAI